MKVLPRKPVLPHVEGKPDTLLVVASSFERRCSGLVTRLAAQTPRYAADAIVLIRYDDRGDAAVGQKVEANLKEMMPSLTTLAGNKRVEPLELYPYDMLDAQKAFTTLFTSIPKGSSVMVDISALTKPHLIYLLQAASESQRIDHLRLAYTRARYGRYDAMSWGAEEPLILPGFGKTRPLTDRGSHLALFCGLEPERCYSIWRRFGQGGGVRLFVDSGSEDLDRCADRAMRYSGLLAEMPPMVLPAFSPDEVVARLDKIHERTKRAGKHLFVGPLTTKWEAVAVWQFFRRKGRKPNASIVYAAPGRFNVLGYTRELVGETLISDLSAEELHQ